MVWTDTKPFGAVLQSPPSWHSIRTTCAVGCTSELGLNSIHSHQPVELSLSASLASIVLQPQNKHQLLSWLAAAGVAAIIERYQPGNSTIQSLRGQFCPSMVKA
eukprot:5786507-Amphidinium_carterae.1